MKKLSVPFPPFLKSTYSLISANQHLVLGRRLQSAAIYAVLTVSATVL